ncbi:hypothetical protein H2200_002834 [Cladophialophora chaetospira]|uniref:Cytochrome P450 n=1 Tax=Cladophialophora chaetospira TaxID=386627 RepID=A0AA38XG75_9EURO|nr:hypothetical protein H2200_002834 [Cladophialophora chaetospira]
MAVSFSLLVGTLFSAWAILRLYNLFYNLFLHPLRDYPGPLGARSTTWWKTYIEVVQQESFVHVVMKLHEQYGSIVRVSPNELHFSDPSAFHDIYNAGAKWDKEDELYASFGEDHSSFGFRTYEEAKQRKEIMQPLFSSRAIINLQSLAWEKIDRLVSTMSARKEKSIDMLFALRCFTIDMVTTFCFARSVDAIDAPDFKAPIVEAMHTSNPTFVLLKHFPLFRKTLFSLPPWLAIKASPETAGLTNLQVILAEQVHEVVTNPESLNKAPHPIIYHRLLDKEVNKGQPIPDATSLREEAAALMFGGGDSAANTLTVGLFQILDQPKLYDRLKDEVYQAWPNLDTHPTYETLQKLPVLTATIKESLRYAPGVPSSLLRIVPPVGASIGGKHIPGGTAVGMSTVLVHRSSEVWGNPEVFDIERWMGPDAAGLDKWLVSFSKGPRSCLGVNLAYCEMYVALATLIRRLDMKLDGTKAEDLVWRDVFLPFFYGKRLRVWCEPVKS